MSSQDGIGNAGPVNSHGAAAASAHRSHSREQKMAAYNVSVSVVLTLTLAAAVAVVVITFVYWAPQALVPHIPPNFKDPEKPRLDKPKLPNNEGDPDPPPPADPQPDPGYSDFAPKNPESDPGSSDLHLDNPESDPGYSELDIPESPQPLTPRHRPRPPYPIMTLQETPPEVYTQGYRCLQDPHLRIILHGPSPTTANGETPLYETEPKRAFCAVSAGSANLGLSTSLTEMLLESVRATARQISPDEFNKSINSAHTQIAKEARRRPQALVEAKFVDHPVYKQLYAYMHRLSGWEENRFGPYATLSILGVLRRSCHVHGKKANRFLLIAIPPIEDRRNRYFPRTYKNTYRSILTIVSLYNSQHPGDRIEQVRVPLLRAQHSSLPAATLASFAAPAMYLQARRIELAAMLDLTWDPQNTFFYEMQKLLSPSEQSPDAGGRSPLSRPERAPTASPV